MSREQKVPRLEMRGIAKRFGPTVALGGVDLAVHAGEVLALVGENGAGKSTLMKVLSGAHPPDEGEMRLDGQPYRPNGPLEARGHGVAMIYQELSLAPHLTVEENILLGIEPATLGVLKRGEIRQRAQEALAQLGHPDIHPNTRVDRLPVGAQQLVEIARALVVNARVLVLDEPTSSLTGSDVEKLFDLVRRLRDQGLAIVYISHFLEEVLALADRYTVLRDGLSVGSGDIKDTTADGLVELMVGRELTELFPRSPRTPGEVVLRLSDLSGATKPESASLDLRRGEILGISGLVGAGRTELLRAVFGLDVIRSGEVQLGSYVGPYSPLRRWDQGLGLVSEDRKSEGLALGLSIADNLSLSKLTDFGPFGLVLPGRQRTATETWIEKLDVRCRSPLQKIGDLSGGNQQKVAIARLLHHGVEVLLLDEPTRGIDVGSKAQIYRLMDELAVQGKAVLLVSSYLPELLGVCDRIAVMCRGRLGPARPISEVNEHTVMLEATGGLT